MESLIGVNDGANCTEKSGESKINAMIDFVESRVSQDDRENKKSKATEWCVSVHVYVCRYIFIYNIRICTASCDSRRVASGDGKT